MNVLYTQDRLDAMTRRLPSSITPYPRDLAPVFVVGAPRSGTTLLYHMLLSAGGFAQYRAETHIFTSLGPRFGGLRSSKDVERALEVWLDSDCHTLSGLDREPLETAIRERTRCTGDFLRTIMDSMVAAQRAKRWAESTPAHVLHMQQIRAQIPGALFIHVIRDGRNVATSLAKQGWIRPLPFDRDRPVTAAAAYWFWLVQRGRAEGMRVGPAYLEVRYERLVQAPEEALDPIARFIGQPLDYAAIRRVGVGSVARPNTSFPDAADGYLARWREQLSERDAAAVSRMIAPLLSVLGYSAGTDAGGAVDWRRAAYMARFSVRDALKRTNLLSRRVTDLSNFSKGILEVSDEKLAGVRRVPA